MLPRPPPTRIFPLCFQAPFPSPFIKSHALDPMDGAVAPAPPVPAPLVPAVPAPAPPGPPSKGVVGLGCPSLTGAFRRRFLLLDLSAASLSLFSKICFHVPSRPFPPAFITPFPFPPTVSRAVPAKSNASIPPAPTPMSANFSLAGSSIVSINEGPYTSIS